MYTINWNKFKDELFKTIYGIEEEECFTDLIRLQKKGNLDNFTREWETLATRVPRLST